MLIEILLYVLPFEKKETEFVSCNLKSSIAYVNNCLSIVIRNKTHPVRLAVGLRLGKQFHVPFEVVLGFHFVVNTICLSVFFVNRLVYITNLPRTTQKSLIINYLVTLFCFIICLFVRFIRFRSFVHFG